MRHGERVPDSLRCAFGWPDTTCEIGCSKKVDASYKLIQLLLVCLNLWLLSLVDTGMASVHQIASNTTVALSNNYQLSFAIKNHQ